MIRIALPLLIYVFLSAAMAADTIHDEEIESLEKEFALADPKIVRTLAELPDDVLTMLCAPRECDYSDFGEPWNSTDVIHGDEPRGQHLYSGLSDSIAAILYQRGGLLGPSVKLILMKRKSDWACLYGIPRRYEVIDNLKLIQSALFSSASGSLMKCRVKRRSAQ